MLSMPVITPMCSASVVSVHIYVYIHTFVDKKNLNRTLAIDSPFQTFAVGLIIEFID